ncbi:MAG: quinol monooxygenase YgiN [Saprospiraceae bacterium]|jgi:quinol monooxygenase YgiN
MSEKLTVVAKIMAKAGKGELVKQELLKMIDLTRAEDGCINYDLHQDNTNENLFYFHENWESKEHLGAHLKSAHIAAYLKATDGAVEEFVITEMTQIG